MIVKFIATSVVTATAKSSYVRSDDLMACAMYTRRNIVRGIFLWVVDIQQRSQDPVQCLGHLHYPDGKSKDDNRLFRP